MRRRIATALRVVNVVCLFTACHGPSPDHFWKWLSLALALAILANSVYHVPVWPWEQERTPNEQDRDAAAPDA